MRKILLNDEQIEIIKYVKQGLTNIEIGEELGYSSHTIKKKLKHLYKIFYANGRVDFVAKILNYQILD